MSAEQRRENMPRFSINPNFYPYFDDWVAEGCPDGQSFNVGTTGEVYQALGAPEQAIYMLTSKVNTIMQVHPEMTAGVIRKIPEILENPVLVLKSSNSNVKRIQGWLYLEMSRHLLDQLWLCQRRLRFDPKRRRKLTVFAGH